jgi:hypothetical protein
MAPYRDVYVVGCSTHSEAEARIRSLYPSEPNLTIYVSPLQIGAAENLRLARDEVRSWQCGPDVALWSSKFALVGGLFHFKPRVIDPAPASAFPNDGLSGPG